MLLPDSIFSKIFQWNSTLEFRSLGKFLFISLLLRVWLKSVCRINVHLSKCVFPVTLYSPLNKRCINIFERWIIVRTSSLTLKPMAQNLFEIFWKIRSHEDLLWRSSRDTILSSENLVKIFRRKDFTKILIKTIYSKNIQKISIHFL